MDSGTSSKTWSTLIASLKGVATLKNVTEDICQGENQCK